MRLALQGGAWCCVSWCHDNRQCASSSICAVGLEEGRRGGEGRGGEERGGECVFFERNSFFIPASFSHVSFQIIGAVLVFHNIMPTMITPPPFRAPPPTPLPLPTSPFPSSLSPSPSPSPSSSHPLSSYHVEKQVCDKVLSSLRTHHGTYWNGLQAVPFPEGGLAKPVGFFSPPFPTLEALGGEAGMYQHMVAKASCCCCC